MHTKWTNETMYMSIGLSFLKNLYLIKIIQKELQEEKKKNIEINPSPAHPSSSSPLKLISNSTV